MGIFIIGGTNLDIKASSAGQFRYGTSNPGSVWKSVGGVGRNIAHSLALLGSKVVFCSAVGEDEAGTQILNTTAAAGVDIRPVVRSRTDATGTYLAIQDGTGELIGAVSDMRVMKCVTPEILDTWLAEIRSADCLAADTNLPGETLLRLSRLAAEYGIPLLIEPVSVEKSARLCHPALTADWVTPNADELRALWSLSPKTWETFSSYLSTLLREDRLSPEEKQAFKQSGIPLDEKAVATLVSHVSWEDSPRSEGLLVTLGKRGVLLLRPRRSSSHSRSSHSRPGEEQWQGILFPAPSVEVRDPNGAGDTFVAGFLHALYGNPDSEPKRPTSSEPAHRDRASTRAIARAIAYGQACAALTLESEHTTAPELSRERVLQRLKTDILFSKENRNETEKSSP